MCDCTDHKDEIPAYDAQAIESRWMKAWEDSNLFAVDTDDSKPKKYVLEMFPYPSGDLHMGHARNYTIGDAMARQARMRGYDVLHPIGFDAFGLPAENAAIKHNTQAAAWTYKNMDQALATMKRMGFSYDLDRMVKTCSPDYYRWGQWIFEKLWEKGLVYRKKNPVNWCPTCKTVLANEQVTEGKCWRCGTEPEKRDLEQWYFKITEYSQELLDDLEKLPGWPERVKQMQANWIGRSEGAEVDFTLCDKDGEPIEGDEGKIAVFTTRADTLFGVSFFVLAPEYAGLHELVEGTEYEEAVTKIVEDSKHISAVERAQGTLEKHGAFTGRYVVNPVNGEKVPVWVADYVVADYGTGAVMAVPCGDQRDLSLPVSTTCRSCRLSWTMTIALPSRPAARPSIPSMPRPSTGIAPTLPRARSSSPASTPACAAASTPRVRLRSWPTSRPWAAVVARSSSVCATGSFPVSVIGATPSRPSTASIAASCPCLRISCR